MFDARTAPSSTAEVLARLTEKDKAQKAEKADKAEAPKAKAAKKAKGRGKDLKRSCFLVKVLRKNSNNWAIWIKVKVQTVRIGGIFCTDREDARASADTVNIRSNIPSADTSVDPARSSAGVQQKLRCSSGGAKKKVPNAGETAQRPEKNKNVTYKIMSPVKSLSQHISTKLQRISRAFHPLSDYPRSRDLDTSIWLKEVWEKEHIAVRHCAVT